MRLGLHMPLKGGFSRNARRVAQIGFRSVQIFAGNPTSWRLPPPRLEELASRRRLLADLDICPLVIHAAYLVNFCSANPVFLERSRLLMRDTMERAVMLGASYVVMHAGNHGGQGFETGLELFISTLKQELTQWPGEVTLLIENTVGSGTSIGGSFDSLGRILGELDRAAPVGICLDTAHAWSAGYDFSTAERTESAMEELFAAVGMERVKTIHANNTNCPRGARRDRHAHLREGLIPPQSFTRLLAYPWPDKMPVILETPEVGGPWDALNLEDLGSYAAAGREGSS